MGISLNSLGSVIRSAGAKLLGNAIPAGGMMVDLVSDLFGVDSDDPEEIEQAIAKDPQAAPKLRELELKHREVIESIGLQRQQIKLEEERMHQADRSSARSREVDVVKATGKKDVNLYALAWCVVGGYLLTMMAVLFFGGGLQGMPRDICFILVGGLVSGFTSVLQYFFGSSKSSSDKTQMLATKV